MPYPLERSIDHQTKVAVELPRWRKPAPKLVSEEIVIIVKYPSGLVEIHCCPSETEFCELLVD
jgi:hypothetical protein